MLETEPKQQLSSRLIAPFLLSATLGLSLANPARSQDNAYFWTSLPSQTRDSFLGILPRGPINLYIESTSQDKVLKAFQAAGFNPADSYLAHLPKAIKAACLGEAYPTAPITPQKLRGKIEDFAVQKATQTNEIANRHHERGYDSGLEDPATGLEVTEVSAVFDRGLEIPSWARSLVQEWCTPGTVHYNNRWLFFSHDIDPNVDKERNFVEKALKSTGQVKRTALIDLWGGPFCAQAQQPYCSTDGKRLLIQLK